jgi:hypothetical protein
VKNLSVYASRFPSSPLSSVVASDPVADYVGT